MSGVVVSRVDLKRRLYGSRAVYRDSSTSSLARLSLTRLLSYRECADKRRAYSHVALPRSARAENEARRRALKLFGVLSERRLAAFSWRRPPPAHTQTI